MPRILWKGAISFGLVHVPVALYPATSESGIDFDWLDARSMDPVGYRRVNKRTGEEVERSDIVKGVKQDDGDYVIVSDDEIKAAYPKTTQTIAIEGFVAAAQIPYVLLEKPYFLEPMSHGEKVYALLREAMSASGVIGIARVVMHNKEHLAALIPTGSALILNTLRWGADLRDMSDLKLPAAGRRAAGINEAELKMAERLIGDMTVAWDAAQYTDHFSDAVRALIQRRAAAGKTEKVESLETDDRPSGSNVVDLTALLKQSLGSGRGGATRGAAHDDRAIRGAAHKATKKVARKRAA